MGYSTMLLGMGYDQPRNSVNQIVNYLKQNNFQTETEIQENVFNYFRNETWLSNKKYADLLRRAVDKGLVNRVKHKKGRSQYVYFVVPENN
jgi:SOS response regulatory protein OraA/RecX